MKLDDLIGLLDNRLRDFQLSRDYARMNGNLERMNAADKEVAALEETLYQLRLLADTSESAKAREAVLSEVMTDGSISVLSEYDITPYATDPLHEEKVMTILSKMDVMDTVEKIDKYITSKYLSSPVTGEMVMSAALAYDVDVRLTMAIMEQDSSFGTAGLAVRTRNPGNVGNDDAGNIRTYNSWQEGVTAVAEWLNRHRTSGVYEVTSASTTPPTYTTTLPVTSTTTTSTTSTTTSPVFATTTSPTSTSTSPTTSTTTPSTTSTSTSPTATSTPPVTSTSTPPTSTSTTPVTSTTTTSTTSTTTSPVTPTSTPATSTSTSPTATTTPSTTSTTTPEAGDSTEGADSATSTSEIDNTTDDTDAVVPETDIPAENTTSTVTTN